MMGMIFWWPILLLFLALPIALATGVYLFYRQAEQRRGLISSRSEVALRGYIRACISCGRFLQEDWIKCPYCGSEVSHARK